MELIDTLQQEHELIDRVLGSFRRYAVGLVDGNADPDDGARFVAFFTEFVGGFHDGREEQVLFDALVTEAELPRDRGPVYAITREHAELEEWLRELTPYVVQRPQSQDDRTRLQTQAVRYSQALWRHIDAENSVLYPEAAERLDRYAIRELPDRPITAAAAAARDDAAALLTRYPPMEDAVLTRGEGCFMCRAYGDTCEGLEAEWWTDLEWDEFHQR